MADPYFTLKDYASYVSVHAAMRREYQNPDLWWKKAVLNTACAGYFSSDRTIAEYNDRIWKLSPLKLDTFKR